jgi:hypothetical protein
MSADVATASVVFAFGSPAPPRAHLHPFHQETTSDSEPQAWVLTSTCRHIGGHPEGINDGATYSESSAAAREEASP